MDSLSTVEVWFGMITTDKCVTLGVSIPSVLFLVTSGVSGGGCSGSSVCFKQFYVLQASLPAAYQSALYMGVCTGSPRLGGDREGSALYVKCLLVLALPVKGLRLFSDCVGTPKGKLLCDKRHHCISALSEYTLLSSRSQARAALQV